MGEQRIVITSNKYIYCFKSINFQKLKSYKWIWLEEKLQSEKQLIANWILQELNDQRKN